MLTCIKILEGRNNRYIQYEKSGETVMAKKKNAKNTNQTGGANPNTKNGGQTRGGDGKKQQDDTQY